MSAAIISAEQFDQMLLEGRPLIDLRAPLEFAKGAFPTSVSLPLMNDAERALVGACYKQQGQNAAIKLGYELVSGAAKAARMAAWIAQIKHRPDSLLYCLRGGLRSQITQQWLADAGFPLARIEGGYKCLRNHSLQRIKQLIETMPIVVLSGRTGTGKTRILQALEVLKLDTIDLEGMAHHRGSSFGKRLEAQPSQINFESTLMMALLTVSQHQPSSVIFEDESGLIGRCMLPECVQLKLRQSPIVVLEDDFSARVERIVSEYVIEALTQRLGLFEAPQEAHKDLAQSLQTNLYKIRKRLGHQDHQLGQDMLSEAIANDNLDLLTTDALTGFQGHKQWVGFLLQKYYDPMYDYQLSRKQGQVVARGYVEEIQPWLAKVAAP